MTQRKNTSINIDLALYQRFKTSLVSEGVNIGEWMDSAVRGWLDSRKMPTHSKAEEEVVRALRRLLAKEKSLMVTLPLLLGISAETLEKFRDMR